MALECLEVEVSGEEKQEWILRKEQKIKRI